MKTLYFQVVLYCRSGLGVPPLLYDKIHINKLFDLMDRFQTGFVELQQFETGLKTLGICSYNGDPEVNDEGVLDLTSLIQFSVCFFRDDIERSVCGGNLRCRTSSF